MIKSRKYLLTLLILFIIPLNVLAGNPVFEGSGEKTIDIDDSTDGSTNDCKVEGKGLSCSGEVTDSWTTYSCPEGTPHGETQCYIAGTPGSCPSGTSGDPCCPGGGWNAMGTGRCNDGSYPRAKTGGTSGRIVDATATTHYKKKYTVKYDNSNCGGSGSVSVGDDKKEYNFWEVRSSKSIDLWNTDSLANSWTGADKCGNLYTSDVAANVEGERVHHYDTVFSRCCGGVSSSDIPKANFPAHCYRKPDPSSNDYIYKWTNVQIDDSVSSWEVVDAIKSEDDCVPPNPSVCSSISKLVKKEDTNAKYCNAKDVNVKVDSNLGCVDDSNGFYSITCSDAVSASYYPKGFSKVLVNGILDEKIVSVLAGQGFEFSIKMNHRKSCVGMFNKNNFDDAYNKATAFITRAERSYNQLKNADTLAEIAWYTQVRQGIVDIVNGYVAQYTNLGSKTSDSLSYSGNISYNYTYKGSSKTHRSNFESSDDTKIKIDQNSHTATHHLANGMNVHDFQYTITQSSTLIPSPVYFDKTSGEETSSSTDGAIAGGNKVYTSLRTDATDNNNYYKMNINIDVYSGSKIIANVRNDNCQLNIYKDDTIKYRIINVTNPFVNSTREIPKNWLNAIYDYTKTIKSDTWSRSSLYKFYISKEDLTDIKRSNYNDSNSYLGTCYKPVANQDYAIRSICSIINSK